MSKKRPRVIIFSLYGRNGASSRYRILQYIRDIEEFADVKICSFWPDTYNDKYMHHKKRYFLQIGLLFFLNSIKRIYQLLFVAPNYDRVIIQKGLIPRIKSTFLSNIKKKHVPILFDVDDAVYTMPRDNTNYIAAKSDLVLCGSERLLEHYHKLNDRACYVPTVDDERKYETLIHDTYPEKIIGWIGNSINLKNIEYIINPINNIVKRHPEVSFTIICNTDKDLCKRILNSRLIQWDIDTYLEELSRISIGVMPLEDTEVNRGKCAFKLIQYMTMRKPVVASPVGENVKVAKMGGYLARTPDEWESRMEQLLFSGKSYYSAVDTIENEFVPQYSYVSNLSILKNFVLNGV